jgi:glycosyltransferase involved in cell wall biosynthesis
LNSSFTNNGRDASLDRAPIKVLVVGQTPPPCHGQAIMIEQLVESQLADLELVHVRLGFSSRIDEVGRFRFSKILHMFAVVARIIYHRFVDRARILYFPPAGSNRVPMFRDFFILICTRWLFDKTIFHFHASGVSDLYDELPFWQRWLFRRAYFGVDAAVRISALNPEDGMRLAAKREFVVPNGIDDPCPGLSVEPSNRAVTADEPLRILFVGALRESKGVLVLIEACSKLVARGVPFRVEIMGQWKGDDFAARVSKRIQELKLNEHVRFLGTLSGDEKFDAYRRADVFCFPTFFSAESFGLVLVEAMACGLPVVSTRWRGIPSVVDDGRTGLLVEPHNSEALADQLVRLAEDGELRKQMGLAGRQRFLREFSLERHLDRMRDVFLDVAGVARPCRKEFAKQPAGKLSASLEVCFSFIYFALLQTAL